MIVLSGADLVLPDRILPSGILTIGDDGRIGGISAGEPNAPAGAVSLAGLTVVPGFIDVHVHGVAGVDTMDGRNAIERLAAALPRFGVTAFCPTTVACAPDVLRRVLLEVRRLREQPTSNAARALPAHLESNFINPDYCGAQPRACIRSAVVAPDASVASRERSSEFSGADVVRVIEEFASDIAIVTLAPEIDGGLELITKLVALGIRVSLGHSGATFEQAREAIAAGARQATHLFNRMPPLNHRAPGLAGAVLQSDDVAVEIICDGVHVHPAVVQLAIARKTPMRVMAISDGTAAAALPAGTVATLGGRSIVVHDGCARLADGTMAGSVLTMDGAFRMLMRDAGCSPVEAAAMCSATPARELGLANTGAIATGAFADLVVLDRAGRVVQTWIGGRVAYERDTPAGNSLSAPSV